MFDGQFRNQIEAGLRPIGNSIRKTGIDQTLSQTTRVELMPLVYMAVSTVSNTVSAVTACTGYSKMTRIWTK